MIRKEIISCNVMECSVNTNCPKGGDAGHGGVTFFMLEDFASTNINVSINNGEFQEVDILKIELKGDLECDTFIEALQFAYQALKQLRENNEHER